MSKKSRWDGAVGVLAALLVGAAGCMHATDDTGKVAGSLGGGGCEDGGDAGSDGGLSFESGEADGGSEASAPACDLSKPFDPPQVVPGLDDRDIFSARLSADERSVVLAIANGANGSDLYVASRATTADPFVIGSPIAELDTAADEFWPSLSADGKMIFFESSRTLSPDDAGAYSNDVARIWAATRPNVQSPFTAPTILGAFRVDGGPEAAPYLHPAGRTLYFASRARGTKGDLDLFAADITDFGVVTAARSLDSANSEVEENMPVVSYDERALFFARPDVGNNDAIRNVWVVGRATTSSSFGVAQQVVEVSSSFDEFPSSVSQDGCRLYLVSNRPVAGVQRYRVWVAEKPR